jgi:hypothetical protein
MVCGAKRQGSINFLFVLLPARAAMLLRPTVHFVVIGTPEFDAATGESDSIRIDIAVCIDLNHE